MGRMKERFFTVQDLTMEGQKKKSLLASITKPGVKNSRPSSMVVKKAHTIVPAHILAEAISTIRGLDIRWSGPITTTEMQYAEQYVLAKYPQYAGEQYVLAKYPQYAGFIGEKVDLSTLCINEEISEPSPDDKNKSPRASPREVSTPSLGSNHPDLDRIQLEPSRLLDILTEKSSFPGSFVSIPEVQAQHKVLRHCGLLDNEYLVLFTQNYKDAMMLVGESYPFFRGRFYMTAIGEEMDHVKEFASYKESKVIPTPETWLDLRIKGSQLSQYFRRKCKHSLKGLFSYPADVHGTRYSMHWVSEAHRNSWHVLLDATALVVGKDRLNLALHGPDIVLCSPDNTPTNPSTITCLLVRKRSFDTTAASS